MRLPEVPALAVGVSDVAFVSLAGEVETLSCEQAVRRLAGGAPPLVCHARAVARRLSLPGLAAYDVLELFAFVRPARFCVPTPAQLALALRLPEPESAAGEAAALFAVARALLAELNASPGEDALPIAFAMAAAGWRWGPAVLAALGGMDPPAGRLADGLKVWHRLPEWQERGAEPPPDSWPVEPVEARARLVQLLGAGAEPRPQQMQYASHAAAAFQPRDRTGQPRVVLAEAGTGIGKTLGYVAPANLWARKNRGCVWISTYTRNLQRQLDRELDRAYPDLRDKAKRVVVRKGRENMFCLLNFEEAVARLPMQGHGDAITLGLVARWLLATRDGDMIGGDFPAWLADMLGAGLTVDLTDTRGECIYSACRHFRRCFIERAIRKARQAEIVIANHALVMIQAARDADEVPLPTRYVFDEGHHLFDAADSVFSLHLSALETAELRRWLRGGEDGVRSRRRGLAERMGDLVTDDAEAIEAMQAVFDAARALPGPGWRQRLAGGTPVGAAEAFLALVRQQVYARAADGDAAYSLEAAVRPAVPGLLDAAHALARALARFRQPVMRLTAALTARLDAGAGTMETQQRQRIESVRRSLQRRADLPIAGWIEMLHALDGDTPPAFVDWLAVERVDGREIDIGLFRHWLDPARPFAETVLAPAHGALITSASLLDGTGDADRDWEAAETRTGARHLEAPPVLSALASPFDYARQTRIIVVTDVNRDDPRQVAAAYRELFLAAAGGALGLFTAISRLRATYRAIAPPLDAAGIRLFAQHVDAMDTGTLIDIFRAEQNACLLGTDAVRDGVDVPGRSLRLIVFDRVPWPRPTILHRARREAFGGRAYDEMLTRFKLKQAYGRLIRRADDQGVFVMLERATPSRLLGAFPEGVAVHRIGLAAAVAATRDHLARYAGNLRH
jgi:ATP-dependent DNA helicase DinG